MLEKTLFAPFMLNGQHYYENPKRWGGMFSQIGVIEGERERWYREVQEVDREFGGAREKKKEEVRSRYLSGICYLIFKSAVEGFDLRE